MTRVDMGSAVDKWLGDNPAPEDDEPEGKEAVPEPTDKRDLVKHLRAVIREKQQRHPEEVRGAFTYGYKLGSTLERRKITAEEAAKELGLTEAVTAAFFKLHPRENPTTEALLAFATELGVSPNGEKPVPPQEPPQEPEPEPAKVSIWPPSGGGDAPPTLGGPTGEGASVSEPPPPPRRKRKKES